MTVDPSSLILGLALLALVGAVAGFLAGLLGIGGGLILVPALYYLLGLLGADPEVSMHSAVGTSLMTIIVTAIASTRAHARRGAVDWQLLRDWAPWVAVGVVIGTALASQVRGVVLTGMFGAVALLVAAYLGIAPERMSLSERPPTGPVRAAAGGMIGVVSAMVGIGGGSLSVPVMALCGYPIRRAVGTSSSIGLIIAVFGAVGFAVTGWGVPGRAPFSLGYVNLIGFLVVTPATMLTAPLGARVAHTVDPKLLRRFFAVFLAVVAFSFFYELT